MRINIDSHKIKNCYGNITHFKGWSDGFLATPNGIVDIMTDTRNEHVRFDFAYGGRHYIKTFNATVVENWSDRKLKAQARIFMNDIVSKKL